MPNRAGIIQGLIILNKYDEGGYCAAEHDILYSCVPVNTVTPEDGEALEAHGWHRDTGADCWAAFV